MPPNGAAGSKTLNVFAQITPARSFCAIRYALAPLSVQTPADSP